MKGFCKVMVLGRVGKEPVIRYTKSNLIVALFSIAVQTKEDKTEWYDIVAFGQLAEIIQKFVKKGARVYVEGRLQVSTYTDKNYQQEKKKTQIVIDKIEIIDFIKDSENNNSNENTSAESTPQINLDNFDDDIPF